VSTLAATTCRGRVRRPRGGRISSCAAARPGCRAGIRRGGPDTPPNRRPPGSSARELRVQDARPACLAARTCAGERAARCGSAARRAAPPAAARDACALHTWRSHPRSNPCGEGAVECKASGRRRRGRRLGGGVRPPRRIPARHPGRAAAQDEIPAAARPANTATNRSSPPTSTPYFSCPPSTPSSTSAASSAIWQVARGERHAAGRRLNKALAPRCAGAVAAVRTIAGDAPVVALCAETAPGCRKLASVAPARPDRRPARPLGSRQIDDCQPLMRRCRAGDPGRPRQGPQRPPTRRPAANYSSRPPARS